MAEQFDLSVSDLYQNGDIFQDDEGNRYLLRERLEAINFDGDFAYTFDSEDELDSLMYAYNRRSIADSHKYWWLLSDRNNCFDPIRNLFIGEDGILESIDDRERFIPKVTKQKNALENEKSLF